MLAIRPRHSQHWVGRDLTQRARFKPTDKTQSLRMATNEALPSTTVVAVQEAPGRGSATPRVRGSSVQCRWSSTGPTNQARQHTQVVEIKSLFPRVRSLSLIWIIWIMNLHIDRHGRPKCRGSRGCDCRSTTDCGTLLCRVRPRVRPLMLGFRSNPYRGIVWRNCSGVIHQELK
ncbi:hypothetical protein VTI28DRAFT_8427 [Corynascus sepedonium]